MGERAIYELGKPDGKTYYTLFLYDQETKTWENYFASFDLEEVKTEIDDGEVYSRELSSKQYMVLVFEDYDDSDYAKWVEEFITKINEVSELGKTIFKEADLDLISYSITKGHIVQVVYVEDDGEEVLEKTSEGLEDNDETVKVLSDTIDGVEGSYLKVKTKDGKCLGYVTVITGLQPEEIVADYTSCPYFDEWSKQYNGASMDI